MLDNQMELVCTVVAELYEAAKKAEAAGQRYLPDAERMLAVEKSAAEHLEVAERPATLPDAARFAVSDPALAARGGLRDQSRRTVHLRLAGPRASQCTCEHPQQHGTPCRHVLAACRRASPWAGDTAAWERWMGREVAPRLHARALQ